MKDIVTPVPQDEVKAVIRRCLEQAALVNYQRLSEYAKVEGRKHTFFPFESMFSYLPCLLKGSSNIRHLTCFSHGDSVSNSDAVRYGSIDEKNLL